MTGGRRRTELLVVAALVAVVIAPLVVGLLVLRRPTWFPVLDLAMTEYRVRDVLTARSPLIGLPGRIGPSLAEQGSHPGPLSFYLVAPIYRLLGSTAWAMQVATVVIHGAAIAIAIVIARRRGGLRLAAAVALLLALLLRGYGVTLLTQPWNPYLPVVWWIVLLLAVWSVLDDDPAMLPIAVLAASLCAQTHVPYLALSLGLGALATGAAALALRRVPAGSARRRTTVRWVLVALGLGVVLWMPPLIDQLVHEPGNLARLATHFGDPPEKPVGLSTGVRLALQHLDLTTMLRADDGSLDIATSGTTGPIAAGVVVLVSWLVAVAIAVAKAVRRRRARGPSEGVSLLRLHAVIGTALVLGALSISRIFGSLWWYLMLWAWGVALLLALAVAWTALSVLGGERRFGRSATGLLVTLTVVASGIFSIGALDAELPAARLSEGLAALVPDTVAALDDEVAGATGNTGTYVVAWSDSVHIGAQAYGLVSELERRGYRAGMTKGLAVPLTRHRVIDPVTATAEIHFASGRNIETFRAKPGAVEVATADPRTPRERAEFDRLRVRAADELRAQRLDDVRGYLDTDLFRASIDPRVEPGTRRRIARLVELGEPMAVFLAPPGTSL